MLVDYAIAWAHQHNLSLCICFVDLEKVFDMAPNLHMLEVLLKFGIDKHLVEVIHRLYSNAQGQVAGDN